MARELTGLLGRKPTFLFARGEEDWSPDRVVPGNVKEIAVKLTSAVLAEMILLTAVLVLGVEGARAEGFADLYVGGVFIPDTDQTVGAMGTGASRETDFDNSFLSGGRVGYWLESVPWLGFALTGGYYHVKEDAEPTGESRISLDVVPASALLMLRYPLLKSSEYPRGQVYPYVGVGPAMFVTKAKVQLTTLPAPNKFSDTSIEAGADVRAGVTLFHPTQSWSVFLEYRFTYVGSSTFKDDIGAVPVDWKLDSMSTQSFLFGAGYHF